ncbi:hypothetical protein KIN20_036301, partial [Parelaphostrongylus tenuis]
FACVKSFRCDHINMLCAGDTSRQFKGLAEFLDIDKAMVELLCILTWTHTYHHDGGQIERISASTYISTVKYWSKTVSGRLIFFPTSAFNFDLTSSSNQQVESRSRIHRRNPFLGNDSVKT